MTDGTEVPPHALVPKLTELPPSLLLGGLGLEKGDHVGSQRSIGQAEAHAGAGDRRLWIGQPTVQSGLGPDDLRRFKPRRIGKARRRACFAAINTTMRGADAICFNRMSS